MNNGPGPGVDSPQELEQAASGTAQKKDGIREVAEGTDGFRRHRNVPCPQAGGPLPRRFRHG